MAQELIIPGLSEGQQTNVTAMWHQLRGLVSRNMVREKYYDAEQKLRSVTSAIPPQFHNLVTVLGWPAKAVDTLANRCVLEAFVSERSNLIDSLEIDRLLSDNHVLSESAQDHTSALIHGVSFLTVTAGDTTLGEPEVVIAGRDATSGTGLWNGRTRQLDAFLSVIATDDRRQATEIVYYDRNVVIEARKDGGRWEINSRANPLQRVPVYTLPFKPRLQRPFGCSRISKPVMAYTNLAMRTVLRSEVTAELYSVPQRVFLGGENSDFKDEAGNPLPQWQYVMSQVFNVPVNNEGDAPSMVETKQAAQTPHMEQLRNLAQLFAGETSIPVASLGISTEANPASAEAYYASREDLIGLAEQTQRDFSAGWRAAIVTASQLAQNETGEIPAEWLTIQPKWRPAQYSSRAAAVDAVTKLIPQLPWMAESDVTIEQLGFDPVTTARLKADRRRLGANNLIDRIEAAATATGALQDNTDGDTAAGA